MDRIQVQASMLRKLLFSADTSTTYLNALTLTGTILKESAQLLWLIICSVFVFGAWVSDTSVKTGNGLRTWIDEQSNPTAADAADKKDFTATGKALLENGRTSASYLLAQAREQIGLEPEPPKPAKKKTEPQKPAAVKSAPAPSAPPAVTAPAATTPSVAVKEISEPAVGSGSATSASTEAVDEVSREASDDGWPPQADND